MDKIISIFKERFLGIIKSPTVTLGSLMNDKKWQGTMALLLLFTLIIGIITAPVILKMNFEKNPDLYASFPESIGIMGQILMGLTAIFVYLIRLVIITFFIYLFFTIFGAEGLFVNYFSLVVNSFLLTVFIPELFKSVYLLIFGKIINPFNLGVFFDFPEGPNWLYYILVEIDIFQIWFVFLIANGVFGFYMLNKEKWESNKFSINKSFSIAILYFVFKSVIVILFSYLIAKLAVAAQQMILSS